MDFVNKKAFQGTMLAHTDGQVPNLIVTILIKHHTPLDIWCTSLKKACGISGYLLGVNPFDQPGVEAYKKTCSHCLANQVTKRKAELEARLTE